MIWLWIYILTIIISVLFHFIAGHIIKKKFQNIGMGEELEAFKKSFNKEEGLLKRWSKYLVFLVPILNILVGGVEIVDRDKSIFKIKAIIDGYKKNPHREEEKEGVDSNENNY